MSTAQIGEIELYYEEHGRGDPLLLIMGLAADSQAWMFQIPAFAERFRLLLEGGLADPEKPLAEIPLVTEAERRELLAAAEEPAAAAAGSSWMARFLAQAESDPGGVALVEEGREVSYGELRSEVESAGERSGVAGLIQGLATQPAAAQATLLDLAMAIEETCRVDDRDVWVAQGPSAARPSLLALATALLSGGQVHVSPGDLTGLGERLADARATLLLLSPQDFATLASNGDLGRLTLRWLIVVGEHPGAEAVAAWIRRYGERKPRLLRAGRGEGGVWGVGGLVGG